MRPLIAIGVLAASALYARSEAKKAEQRRKLQPVPVTYFEKPATPSLKDTVNAIRSEASSTINALQQNSGIVPPNLKPAVEQQRVVLSLEEVDGPGAAIFREPWPLL